MINVIAATNNPLEIEKLIRTLGQKDHLFLMIDIPAKRS